jgi:hypothetical protein
MHPRIAVHMVESWILADREACSEYLKVSINRIPKFPDDEINPKQVMVGLARRSRSRSIRDEMAPVQGMSGPVGRNYRGYLERFVDQHWSAERAGLYSPSLQRAVRSLQEFRPVLPGN